MPRLADKPSFIVQLPDAGPALVFIHGFMGQPEMWAPVTQQLGELESNRAMIRLPGHGPNPALIPGANFVELVDELARQLAALGPCHLVGYSMGARVALWLALRHPNSVLSGLLIGVNPGLASIEEQKQRHQWDDSQAEVLARDGLQTFVQMWEQLPLFESQKRLREPVLAHQRRQRLNHESDGLLWAFNALGLGRMPAAWSALPLLKVPLTLMSGELDRKYVELMEQMAPLSFHLTTRLVADAGHNVVLEAPDSVVNAVLELRRG